MFSLLTQIQMNMRNQAFNTIAAICLLGGLSFASLLTSRAQDVSLDEFRRMHSELREKMANDLDQAITYLEAQTEKQPDSSDVQVLRHSLASKLADDQRYADAMTQYQKLLDFQIANLDRTDQQSHCFN